MARRVSGYTLTALPILLAIEGGSRRSIAARVAEIDRIERDAHRQAHDEIGSLALAEAKRQRKAAKRLASVRP